MPQPDVKQMLLIGKGCGLRTLDEAVSYYRLHYDLFFDVANYIEQLDEFNNKLIGLGLAEQEQSGAWCLIDISIDDALNMIK